MNQKRLLLAVFTVIILALLTGCSNILDEELDINDQMEVGQNDAEVASFSLEPITFRAKHEVIIKETNREYYCTFNLPRDSVFIDSDDTIIGVEYSFRIDDYDQAGISENFTLCYEDSSGRTKFWPISRSFQLGNKITDYTARFNECEAAKLYFKFKLTGNQKLNKPVRIYDIIIKVKIRPPGIVGVIKNPWETPSIHSGYPETMIALKARYNNKYLCADLNKNSDAPLYARSSTIGPCEMFHMVYLGGEKVALRSKATGKYVCAEKGGERQAVANREKIDEWEIFDLEELSHIKNGVTFKNNVTTKHCDGKYSNWYLRFDGYMQQYQGTGCMFVIEYL